MVNFEHFCDNFWLYYFHYNTGNNFNLFVTQTQIYITVSGLISLVAAHAFVPKLAWLLAGRKELCVADILGKSNTIYK